MADAPSKTTKHTDWSLLRRVWPYARASKGWLWVVLVATPLGVLGQLAQPLLLKTGIDDYIGRGDLEGLGHIAAVFVALVTTAFMARSLGLYALQLIGLRALKSLRRDLFGHVMNQGQGFFDKRSTGTLMTRTTNDVDALYESLSFGAVGLVTDALMIVGTLVMMLVLDWRLTLVAFSISPVIIGVVNLFRKRLRVLFLRIRKALSALNGFFAEQIHGMQVVQLSGAEQRSLKTFRSMAHAYLDDYRKANWWDAALYAIMDGMSALAIGIMLAYGATRVGLEVDGVSLGLLVAFIDYLGKVFGPIREFSGRLATIQAAIAALERVFGLADTDEQIAPGTLSMTQARGALEFSDVSFRYGPDRPYALKGLTFKIEPGEVVALVGATGSGKSTIGKLLLRMYDDYEGSIQVDGQQLRETRLEEARGNVAVVQQDSWLFSGTVAENIALWADGIDRAAVERAADRARATPFISQLDGGFDAVLSERGGNLSTGQKQLLAIARAMARAAPVVILDEATASVDSLTEQLIDEAVDALFDKATVLVIAHRLSTITKADRILVLHHGELVEQGNHEALMALGGRYKVLVETGFAL